METMAHEPESLRDKIAQLFFVRIGSNMPPVRTVAEDAERIIDLIEGCPIGGLLLFNGSADQTPEAIERIRRASRYPLLVASDIERGVGQQIRNATVFPHAAALSRTGPDMVEVTRSFAIHVAREAQAIGIDMCLGPVVDVASNRENPIIATRAFSEDSEVVAQLGRAYVEGMREAGLLCVAKHFPGHGDTHTDSHDEIPVVRRSREEIIALELPPFVAAIHAGVDGIMTAHVSYPSLDSSGTIATGSRHILSDLLRSTLGFEGVILSDSLLMAAVHESLNSSVGAEAALLAAGQDLLLDVSDPIAAVDGIERALEAGLLRVENIEEAFRRVWRMKSKAPASRGVYSGPTLGDLSGRGAALASQIARSAIREVGPTTATESEPLEPSYPLVLLLKPNSGRFDPDEEPLADYLRMHRPDVVYGQIGPEAGVDVYEYWMGEAARRERVVVAMIVKPAAWHRFGLLPRQREFVQDLIKRCRVTLVSLGVPGILDTFEGQVLSVCAFSDVSVSQKAAT
jgi:beta-glucosidase-like glycosyl hydrolase